MTTLAALHLPGRGTWVGADRQVSSGSTRSGIIEKWVVHPSGWAVGAAGFLSTLTIMREKSDMLFKGLKSPYQFGERLKGLLHGHGFVPGNDEPGPMMWGAIQVILASPDGIWDFDCTLGYNAIEPGRLWAAGSGKDFALGAGQALMSVVDDPMMIVTRSLQTAVEIDANSGCGIDTYHLAPIVPARGRRVQPKPAPKRSRAR